MVSSLELAVRAAPAGGWPANTLYSDVALFMARANCETVGTAVTHPHVSSSVYHAIRENCLHEAFDGSPAKLFLALIAGLKTNTSPGS